MHNARFSHLGRARGIVVKHSKKDQKAEPARKLFGTDGIRGAANEPPMTPEMAPASAKPRG